MLTCAQCISFTVQQFNINYVYINNSMIRYCKKKLKSIIVIAYVTIISF